MTEYIFYPNNQIACRGREPTKENYENLGIFNIPDIALSESGAIGESELPWNRKLFQPSKEHLVKMLAGISKGEDQVIDWGK